MAGTEIKALSLRPLAVVLRDRDLSFDEVLHDVGIPHEAASDDELLIPFGRAMAAWDRAAALAQDPALGIISGATLPLGAYGLLDYVAYGGDTLEDAWKRLSRYLPILGGFARARCVTTVDTVSLEFELAPGTSRHAFELALSTIVARARGLVSVRWSAHEVKLPYPHHIPVAVYTKALCVRPVFEANECSIQAPMKWMRTPLLLKDAEMQAVLETLAERRLARSLGTSIVDRVRRIIFERGGVAPSLERVAARLQMSSRTLQRKLGDAGTSLRDVEDAARHELALAYLADRRIGLSETALLVGFSELSAFDRAFKRWTGMTPTRWRHAHGQPAGKIGK